ncbi:MAG TPA: DUF6002 family protein [Mycobacteriales bacterium]|nr:DUF6002 family protein [Mycobacteriales bacterium]
MSDLASPIAPARTANLLLDYYDRLPAVIAATGVDPAPVVDPLAFSPGYPLPDLDDRMRRYLAVATAQWSPLADYGATRLSLLDLTGNPGTQTTKTIASLLIVARAVGHIQRTGEPVLIFTPSSANKATALRDAVERALAAGLATPDQLRIVTLVPASCRDKLRSSGLSADPALRRRNPVLLYDGAQPEDVKPLARTTVRDHAATLRGRGWNLWFTLELQNYVVADAARAFFEQDVAPTAAAGRPRLHAHAVSSAFGLLGYVAGREVLERSGAATTADRPGFLLVQHLGTPDMVLHLRTGSFDRAGLPPYRLDPATGLHRQDADPHFPAVTHDPAEVLDPTFYSRAPLTAPTMTGLIERFGGGGIVVSLAECLARYPHLRQWLEPSGRPLPADFRRLREWSLVMALTGTLTAIDRGLVPADSEIVVHGTGSYAAGDYQPLEPDAGTVVHGADDIAAALPADA